MEIFRLPNIHKEGELEKRVELILKYDSYPKEKLNRCLDFITGKASPSRKDIDNIIKDFKSDRYGFDDIYKFRMTIATFLLNNDDQLTDNTVLNMYEELKLRFSYHIPLRANGSFAEPSPEIYKRVMEYAQDKGIEVEPTPSIAEARRRLKQIGIDSLKELIPQTQSRLALLEIFTLVSLDDIIPELLKVCPKYLHCPIVVDKILDWSNGTKENNESDRNRFRFFCSVMRKKNNPHEKIYKHWFIFHRHSLMENHLTFLMRMDKSKRQKQKENFCSFFGLSKEYLECLERDLFKPKEIALEIIQKEGLIKSEDSFYKIRAKVNILIKKHPINRIPLFTAKNIDKGLSSLNWKEGGLWALFEIYHDDFADKNSHAKTFSQTR